MLEKSCLFIERWILSCAKLSAGNLLRWLEFSKECFGLDLKSRINSSCMCGIDIYSGLVCLWAWGPRYRRGAVVELAGSGSTELDVLLAVVQMTGRRNRTTVHEVKICLYTERYDRDAERKIALESDGNISMWRGYGESCKKDRLGG